MSKSCVHTFEDFVIPFLEYSLAFLTDISRSLLNYLSLAKRGR